MASVSLVRRLGAGIKSFSAGFGSGISTFQPYEAAGFSRKRPVIYGAHARDSSLDLSEWTRTELLKLARHMYRNVGLIKGAVDSIAAYSVGPGLRPQYRGADVEFGKLAEQYWRDVVAPNPEVTGRMTWTDLLLALSRSIDVDGDVFVIMTDKGKLQVVEGHRVCEGDNYESTDGVFLGKMGEPTAYLLELGDTYRKINADLVIHLMEMERPDQIRGGSNLARALNHVRDLKLLGEFEKDALKLQGSIAAVITSNEGDALASSGGFFGNIQPVDTGDNSIAREQITSSATIPRLAPGEKIEMVAPNRPNNGFEPFAKFLIRDVAMGLGLPIEFVYDPASVGGAGMRFIVAKAQRRFEQRQRLLVDRFCNRSWAYFIGRAIANGDLPPAEDYRKVSWQTPKSLTVDAGREQMQAREDYKAGLSSLQDYFGELGLDWEEQVLQMNKEKQFIAALTPAAAPITAAPDEAPIPQEPKADATATDTTTPTDIIDPNEIKPGPNSVPEELQVGLDCGTGSGGFQPGNSCAGGGDAGSPASEPKERYRDRIEGTDEELKNEERKQKRKIKNLKDKIDQSKQRSEDLRKQIADLNKSISDKSSNYNKQLDVIKKESDRIKSDGVLARQKIQQDLDKKLAAIEEKYKKKREARDAKIAEIESAELESKEDTDGEDEIESQVAESENEVDKLKALIAELKKILEDANNAEKNSEELAAPSFIMPDDAPDFNLSAKELNMIVTALGIGKTKAKKTK